ncbi:MAG TPA: hypothetical protein VFV50_11265 [Bdellovibrionales bacterium]|nr:hypothetical protein [Bdellovibrionales bacterium]
MRIWNGISHAAAVTAALTISAISQAQVSCPQTAGDLSASLNDFAREIANGTHSWTRYTEYFAECSSQIRALDVKACSNNLERYTAQRAKMSGGGHSLGFAISNEEYFAKTPGAALELPPEIAGGFPQDWRAKFDQQGWKYIEFFSPSVPFSNPEDPHSATRRLVVYVPNDRGYMKWIQFVPPQTQNNNLENNYHVDLISIDKDDKGQNRQHHNQFIRSSLSQGFYQKPLYQLSGCMACHSMGPRTIKPWPGYLTEGNVTPREMEIIMRDSQNSNWGDALDVKALGPALGKNQGCTSCHAPKENKQPHEAGFLHGQFSSQQIYHKMVESLEMPPNFLRQQRFTTLRSVLSKMRNMSKFQKSLIKGTANRTYEELMDAMLEKYLITRPEYDAARAQLTIARAEQKTSYDRLFADQKEILRSWLLGDDNPGCK